MSDYPHSPTLLIVYLRTEHDELARYYIDEFLISINMAYRLIAQQEQVVSLESAAPFVMKHKEKRLVFALRVPLSSKAIDEIAQMVSTGLILGFVVKGEIELDDAIGVINNLG